MKRALAFLFVIAVAAVILFFGSIHPLLVASHQKAVANHDFLVRTQTASGAIFVDDRFICSGTEIGHDDHGDGYFLTARHCVFDVETNKPTGANWISFTGNEHGPFYAVQAIAISSTDDLAVLRVINGADIPEVWLIGDEHALRNGDPIFNVSYPLGMGKQEFHGQFMRPNFEKVDERMQVEGWDAIYSWTYTMPVNLTIAHGSSGSGIFNTRQRALIGVTVGTFAEGTFNIAVPASRVQNLLVHLKENSADAFIKAHQPKALTWEQIFEQ